MDLLGTLLMSVYGAPAMVKVPNICPAYNCFEFQPQIQMLITKKKVLALDRCNSKNILALEEVLAFKPQLMILGFLSFQPQNEVLAFQHYIKVLGLLHKIEVLTFQPQIKVLGFHAQIDVLIFKPLALNWVLAFPHYIKPKIEVLTFQTQIEVLTFLPYIEVPISQSQIEVIATQPQIVLRTFHLQIKVL